MNLNGQEKGSVAQLERPQVAMNPSQKIFAIALQPVLSVILANLIICLIRTAHVYMSIECETSSSPIISSTGLSLGARLGSGRQPNK